MGAASPAAVHPALPGVQGRPRGLSGPPAASGCEEEGGEAGGCSRAGCLPLGPPFEADVHCTPLQSRRILKRVAVPENDEERRLGFLPRARNFAKLAQSSPEPAIQAMVNSVSSGLCPASACTVPWVAPALLFASQIEDYGNQAELFADIFRFLSPLAQDMVVFTVLRRIATPASKRAKLSDDGINLVPWVLNLARFAGLIGRAAGGNKFCGLDVRDGARDQMPCRLARLLTHASARCPRPSAAHADPPVRGERAQGERGPGPPTSP